MNPSSYSATRDERLRCLSPASFWSPEHVVQSGWLEHGPFAFWLMESARPRVFVELGTHHGYSFFAACQAVQRLNLGTACYAVDTWQGDEHAGHYDDSVYNDVVARTERSYAGFARLMRSTFDEALSHFRDGSVDLLHIDGRHRYEDARHDFDTWLPKLSKRGVVLFHDINVRERDFGVWRLWDEIASKYPSFAFIHGHGLGAIAVGEEIPAALAPLFDADESTAQTIRDAYGRLGESVTRQYLLDRARANIGDMQTDLIRSQATVEGASIRVTALEHEIARLHALAQAREAEAEARAAEAKERDALATYFSTRYAELARQSSKLHESAAGKLSSWLFDFTLPPASSPRRTLGDALTGARTFSPWARRPKPTDASIAAEELRASPLFDAAWYLSRNPDVAEARIDPAEHYLLYGASEGRDPGEYFSTCGYLELHPDVAASATNPLVHYLREGRREGRKLVPTVHANSRARV